ncbi:MAG: ATP-binding protein, partial [Candidatus Micrarchaeaceae archaeon]
MHYSIQETMLASIESIIERQKAEANALISSAFVKRDVQIEEYKRKNITKIIVGPRRAGKSMFALQSIKEMKFAYANIDDEGLQLLKKEPDYNELLRALAAVYGRFEILLLDEIQNLKNWQLFVNRLARQGYNLIVTGSNSNLMSTELATHLTGRFIELQVFPFSFKEYIRAKGIEAQQYKEESEGIFLSVLNEYLKIGGYPELVTKGLEKSNYLKMLVDSTIYADIAKRYRIRKQEELRRLFDYLIDIYAKEFTYNSAAEATEINSVNTVSKYFNYLKETYMLFEVERFEPRARLRHKAPKKVYAIDTGLANAMALRIGNDYGRLMENAIAVELLRRGERINYWKDISGREVDFVVLSGTRVKALIQSCYDIGDKKVRKREESALLKAAEQL